MNLLTLSIRQNFFDEILAGTKRQETREVKPSNFNRYARYVYEGKEYKERDDIPGEGALDVAPVKYDALKLLTGQYKNKRPYLIVEVKRAHIYFITDDDGEDVILEENGTEYTMTDIVYDLGNVIEKQLYNNNN
jgi:hypothetical protein